MSCCGQDQRGDVDRRTGLLVPPDRRAVERHLLVVRPELDEELEPGLALFQPGDEVRRGGRTGRRSRARRRCRRTHSGSSLYLTYRSAPNRVREAAPVGRAQNGVDHLLHVVEDLAGDRVGLDVVRRISPLSDWQVNSHMSFAVSTKNTSWFWRRKSWVVASWSGGRSFSPVNAEQLDADAGCALEVGAARLDVAGEPDPDRVLGLLAEDADAEFVAGGPDGRRRLP